MKQKDCDLKKKLAIHFFGFMRTFRDTYNNFKLNILDINSQDYEIDIFIHTWDKYNSTDTSKECFDLWHKNIDYYPTMNEKQITSQDQRDIIDLYQPKKILIEKLEKGVYGHPITLNKVSNLRIAYEKENGFKYDAFLYTRCDIMFKTPIRILGYIDYWKNNPDLDTKIIWCGHSSFSRMAIADPRIVTECNIFWFTKYDISADDMYHNCPYDINKFLWIGIDYLLYRDFRIWREKYVDYKATELTYIRKDILIRKDNEITKLKLDNQLLEDKWTKRQILELSILEQDLIIKKLETKKLAKSLGIKMNIINPKIAFIQAHSAKARIRSHLCYKLGQAMIENSRSILGYIRIPYVLSYIMDKHKFEQKAYKAKIKENPNLALPPLETYSDYNEALKLKNSFTYKIGEALIKAHK
ncbi:alpha-2,3-sialyltransferase, partial [Campylobacter jejuni]|nr:alpha-2,3-sialyltransferase [Campylobacter jejuni]EAI4276353.1 alpha-2,3-sialyltransferase [Campylobacter jejuni]EAJ7892000.1 alpha-2,3-sialyltransferase [Campylobacter jejuni]EAL4778000.1 alpha-2,3-sialyltransferase [Campylobacter jejuni]EEU6661405.1 alpha-2,3-sialyltransferase [Campylobacter jejuni]